MHDRTPSTLSLLLTCPNMPADKILTQTIFNLHPGHFLTWERPLDTSSGVSPRYLSATNSQLTTSPHYRHSAMSNYDFFFKDPSQWQETFQSLWGHLDICSVLHQFHITSITYLELSSLTSLKAWGDAEKFHSDIVYLLVSTEEGAAKDRIYGLSTIWVNPYQARVPTMEEVVKQLTALVPMGSNWPYTLVHLNGDTCQVPLPREGHLSAMVEGISSATCR